MTHFFFKPLLVLLSIFFLTACQNHVKSTKLIAGVFNFSTDIQQKMIEKRAPQNVLVTRNIVYQHDPKLSFDLYQPENIAEHGLRPTVVWIHGGGWISGSKEHGSGYFKMLAQQGFNVISVEYQMAPEHVYPTQLQQIDRALAYISHHAIEYHIDANSLFLAGDSAGANMASHYAALLTTPNYADSQNFKTSIQPQQIKGLILHCGIYNMRSFVESAPTEIKLLEWGILNLVDAYTGGQKGDLNVLDAISPSQHLSSDYPAVFISGGNKDFLTESQSYPFVEQLHRFNIPVSAVFYPESKELLFHEYQFMMSKKASQQTLAASIDFLNQYSN